MIIETPITLGGNLQVVNQKSLNGSLGTPVIFIHGLINSIYYLDEHYFDVFETVGPVYSVPLPGHYPSVYREPLESLSFDRVVEMLIETIRELIGTDQDYILIGHSTGALVSMGIAIRDESNVKAMVSVGGATSGIEFGGSMVALQKMSLKGFGWGAKLMLKCNSFNQGFHRIGMAEVFSSKDYRKNYDFDAFEAYYLPAMKALDGNIIVRYLRFLAEIDLTEKVSAINCPCLFITGREDPYISVDENKIIADSIKDGVLRVIEGSGHWPMYEQSIEFQSSLGDWFKEKELV